MAVFSIFDIYRLEVADDVITGVAVEQVDMDVRGKFEVYTLNNGKLFRLLAQPNPFSHICAVFNCVLQPTGRS